MFAVIFVFIFLLHLPLLRLPYFWDEGGYYVPAARDFLLTGSLIPHSTVSNAHPPLVMAWLALWWKLVGYAPVVTRTAMLVLAAFSLLGLFRLAQRVANTEIAIASTLCTALYPVFFAQSSLAQVDLAAAGLTFWALAAYVEGEAVATAIWFSLVALTKETAIVAPVAIALWEILGRLAGQFAGRHQGKLWLHREGNITSNRSARHIGSLLLPVAPLVVWYAYHYARTGYVFGNPEFFRYNVAGTLGLTRFLLALAMRLWQITGYLHLWMLTLGTMVATWTLRHRDSCARGHSIGTPIQMLFYIVISAYVIAMSLIGGAVLARYLLPAVPLVIILSVATVWRRLRYWRIATALVAMAFVAAWFWNPHYGFAPEDNLAYRDYVLLHQEGERFLEARYPMARVLTAWPATDELTRPWLGYTTRPMRVVQIENFSMDELISAADFRSNYEIAFVFSTKYEPGPALWDGWEGWAKVKTRFFGFHRDVLADIAASTLGGHIVFSAHRQGQWVAVIEILRDQVLNAQIRSNDQAVRRVDYAWSKWQE